jgi:hypothetical protein
MDMISKNPGSRGIHHNNQQVYIMDSITCFEVIDDPGRPVGQKYYTSFDQVEPHTREKPGQDLKIRVSIKEYTDKDWTLVKWIDAVRHMSDDQLRMWLCGSVMGGHNWYSDEPPEV